MKKRIISLLLSVVLVLSVFSYTNAEEISDKSGTASDQKEAQPLQGGSDADDLVEGFKEVASVKNFSLYVDESNCYIAVKDKRNNSVWYSNPTVDDPLAQGMENTNIKSQLIVEYTTASSIQKTTNSNSSTVVYNSFTTEKITNGLRVNYDFKQEKFMIPVTYVIDDEGMTASILFDEIDEYGTNKINTIEFLKYFGAGSLKDNGSMFVPDGNGAVINFNNGKTSLDSYSKPFYGYDLAVRPDIESSRMEKISLPIYGMIKNGKGFLAEVTSGAELATLNASIAGKTSSYNQINTCVTYRTSQKISMLDQSLSSTKDALYNAMHPATIANYSIKFHFVASSDANYNDFADIYRQVLKNKGLKKTSGSNSPLFIEFFGGVRKRKSFAGIPYDGKEKLTSFSEAEAILKDIQSGGVNNFNVLYEDYSDDTFNRDIQVKLNPSSFLGGKNGIVSLQNYTESQGFGFYPSADFMNMPTGGNGFSPFFDESLAINISPILVYKYSLNTNLKDGNRKPWYLLAPNKYPKAIDKLLEAAKKIGYKSYYFNDDALELYSDLSKNGYQREQTKEATIDAFEKLSESMSVTLSNPNDYLLPYADSITNIPMTSSHCLIFDYDIPFYTMVLKGLIPFSGKSINIDDDSQEVFLQDIENGANLKYSLINADSTVLATTDHTFLYSANYNTFKDEIQTRYAEIEALNQKIGDASIVSHSKSNDVAVVTYSNNKKVYINYSNQDVSQDGLTIPANGYAVE